MNNLIRRLLLALPLLWASVAMADNLPTLSCKTSTSMFNTAYDGTTGGKLPNGTMDPHWDFGAGTAGAGPTSVSTWRDAYVYQLPFAWASSPFNNASWISQSANGDTIASSVYFRYQFNLDATVPPNNIALLLTYYVDNNVREIYVNGHPQSSYGAIPSGGFYPSDVSSTTLNHDWQAGMNEIVFETYDGGGSGGLMVQTTPTSTLCPNSPIVVNKTVAETTVTPNGSVNYTVTVTNAGTAIAKDIVVTDTPPSDLSDLQWTCEGTNGATCPNTTGSGPIHESVPGLPADGVITYKLKAKVSANPPANLTNTVSVDPGNGVCANGGAAPCSASATVPPVGMVSITKVSNTTGSVVPGSSVQYTIKVSNVGSVPATQVKVEDPLPVGLASGTWTCSGSCSATTNGNLPLTDVLDTLPAGQTATYTINAEAQTTNLPLSIVNTASATPSNGGVCQDGSAAPCVASVSLATRETIDPPFITKAASLTDLKTREITWTITVRNPNPDARIVVFEDPLPVGTTFVSGSVTCSANKVDSCEFDSISAPTKVQSIALLAPNDTLVITVKTVAAANAVSVVNTAKAHFVAQSGFSSQEISATVQASASLKLQTDDIPTLSPSALALLVTLLAAAGLFVAPGVVRKDKQ